MGCDFTSSLLNICNNIILLYFCYSFIILGVAIYLEKKKKEKCFIKFKFFGDYVIISYEGKFLSCVCVCFNLN